jgi:hypothetical protein
MRFLLSILMKILLVSTQIVTHEAHASTVIRIDQGGGSMEHLPARFQKLNLCSADVAVDMIDAWRLSHGYFDSAITNEFQDLTSPIEAALTHKNQPEHRSFSVRAKEFIMSRLWGSSDRPYEWSVTASIIESVRRHGRCSESSYENRQRLEGKNVCAQEDLLIRLGEMIRKLRKDLSVLKETQSGRSDRSINFDRRLIIKQAASEMTTLLQNSMPKIRIPQIESLLIREQSPLKVLFEIYSSGCPARDRPNLPELMTQTIRSEAELNQALDIHFNPLEPLLQPIGIDFCSTLLRSGNTYTGLGIYGLKGHELKMPRINCNPHAAMIIGKRWVESPRGEISWQVLLRNTWGLTPGYHADFEREGVMQDCVNLEYSMGGKYNVPLGHPSIEKILREHPQATTTHVKVFLPLNGNVWVPVESLARNTFQIYYWDY